MSAAYAFTDYRSQGQTISYVLVDIARPPSGTLDLFNLIDLDERLFLGAHSTDLLLPAYVGQEDPEVVGTDDDR
ncbi:hypothetical protein EDC04DRAFT_2818423 [Pisolithus marmoratus]|nr:hypothetical protein EDC04DRAFT_2818423 [Pisolithus marmoratus]